MSTPHVSPIFYTDTPSWELYINFSDFNIVNFGIVNRFDTILFPKTFDGKLFIKQLIF